MTVVPRGAWRALLIGANHRMPPPTRGSPSRAAAAPSLLFQEPWSTPPHRIGRTCPVGIVRRRATIARFPRAAPLWPTIPRVMLLLQVKRALRPPPVGFFEQRRQRG